jgi:hypothetical protein
MARIKIKYDQSGDHVLATADDVENAIQCALESNFYVDIDVITKVVVDIISIADGIVKFNATITKPREEPFDIVGTGTPRVGLSNNEFRTRENKLGRITKTQLVRANLYLVIDWYLAE